MLLEMSTTIKIVKFYLMLLDCVIFINYESLLEIFCLEFPFRLQLIEDSRIALVKCPGGFIEFGKAGVVAGVVDQKFQCLVGKLFECVSLQ